jgi:hypothetical protein
VSWHVDWDSFSWILKKKNTDSSRLSCSPPLSNDNNNTTTTMTMTPTQQGRPHTPESRAKISAANKGKTPWNKGVGHSEETKARIKERTKLVG